MTTLTAAGFLVMTLLSVIMAFVGLCLDVHKKPAVEKKNTIVAKKNDDKKDDDKKPLNNQPQNSAV